MVVTRSAALRIKERDARIESNLREMGAVFYSCDDDEWNDMINASDAMVLDENRDFIEHQIIKEALATAQPGEVDPDF
jgi:hypothetical protein